ncbi:MAG: hypothetical protein AAGA61_07075, partial [Pseudomonadota bacterium]
MIRNAVSFAAITSAGILVSAAVEAQSLRPSDPAEIVAAIEDYRATNERRILNDFAELLSIPNVADNLEDMHRNAEHITAMLEVRGLTTRTLTAGNAPYVYAELQTPDATETVLIYAHFDGQPVQEENWAYPPFAATLLDG